MGILFILYKNDSKIVSKLLNKYDFIFKMVRIEKKNDKRNNYIDFSKMDFEQNDNNISDNKLIVEEK